jgi:hypothetical protein
MITGTATKFYGTRDNLVPAAVTESLEEWWRLQGGRFEAVTVIGTDRSARIHEIRDTVRVAPVRWPAFM